MRTECSRFSDIHEFRNTFDIDTHYLVDGYKHIVRGGFANNNQKVLYVDGITSAGKTTLLHHLKQELPNTHSIPEFNQQIPEIYRNIGQQMCIADQLRAEFWFYNQYLQKDRELRSITGEVIVDRGLLGVFPYSNLLGDQKEVSLRLMRRARQREWVPGTYIFLTAQPEIIKERMMNRQDAAHITEEYWNNGLSDFVNILLPSIEEVATYAQVPLIDTSYKTPQEVLYEVLEMYDEPNSIK